MSVGYYAINLEQNTDRWDHMSAKAKEFSIELIRVAAIDGRKISTEDWADFDTRKWQRCHGQKPRAGEYGCYMSHLKAIEAFIESDFECAVIMEDDAQINAALAPFARQFAEWYSSKSLLLRLAHHREIIFEGLGETIEGSEIGQCWLGPTGSASAYFLTKKGAIELLPSLTPAYLPFDIMLERPWETKVPAFMLRPALLKRPAGFSSTIVDHTQRHSHKFAWYRRFGAYVFRTDQFIRRLIHSAATRRLPARTE